MKRACAMPHQGLTALPNLPHPNNMNRKIFAYLWLSLLLLFAQQGAAVHAISHLPSSSQSQPDKQLPHSQACDKCVVYAGLSGAVAATPQIIPVLPLHLLAAAVFVVFFVSRIRRVYSSRAPPALV